jgi:hypothetical protein
VFSFEDQEPRKMKHSSRSKSLQNQEAKGIEIKKGDGYKTGGEFCVADAKANDAHADWGLDGRHFGDLSLGICVVEELGKG